MSSYVDKDYFYYIRGRELLLYKLLGSRNQNRITQSGVLQSYDNELVYPDEDIENGLRIEYTALNEPFVAESLETTNAILSATTISFDPPDINDSGNRWITSGFATGDKIRIQGSASNDGDYTLTDVGANSLVVAETIAEESVGQRITVTQIPKEVTSPDSTSHINLNKMLSLAVVDYVKAMVSEERGEIDKKEYYMKEFYSKLADNESNKRIISVASSISAYSVR
jgi:hypothetical protein